MNGDVGLFGPGSVTWKLHEEPILLLGGLGYVVDEWRGTSPWFLVTGLFLGIAAGFYAIVKSTLPRGKPPQR